MALMDLEKNDIHGDRYDRLMQQISSRIFCSACNRKIALDGSIRTLINRRKRRVAQLWNRAKAWRRTRQSQEGSLAIIPLNTFVLSYQCDRTTILITSMRTTAGFSMSIFPKVLGEWNKESKHSPLEALHRLHFFGSLAVDAFLVPASSPCPL